MKKKLFSILLILILFFTVISFKSNVSAATATPLNKYNLLWNITSYYYYLDSTATKHATIIQKAAENWVHTGYGWNNLYPNTRTTNITDSACDFFAYWDFDRFGAYTLFFKRANGHTGAVSEADPDKSNWLFCEIHINSKNLADETSTVQQGIICHEFGHTFGLAHNDSNPNSIMCSSVVSNGTKPGRKVQTVQKVDHDAFNKKHP